MRMRLPPSRRQNLVNTIGHGRADGGVTTLVLHPQVSGRPMRWHLLRDFLHYAQAEEDVWIATGAEIAAHYEACELSEAMLPK